MFQTAAIRKPLVLCLAFFWGVISLCAQTVNPNHAVAPLSGVYSYTVAQTPAQLIEVYPPGYPNTGFSYQWEQSTMPVSGFSSIGGATSSSYTFSGPLSQTMYYRRKSTKGATIVYSNTVKVCVVGSDWEDQNYLRQHLVKTGGVATWTDVDQLPIGDQLISTTFYDGLGRELQQVSTGTATPSSPGGTWGDQVQVFQYDVYGRKQKQYLPFTTTSQPGKLKTDPVTEQQTYYSTNFGETSPYASATFDNSPLNRVLNQKQPGTSWAAANGISQEVGTNSTADNVRKWTIDYVAGHAPTDAGAYPANTLYKYTMTDEQGKLVVSFFTKEGTLILKKVQLDDTPADEYNGWICTYSIYDDFGRLTYEILPEGVKYLAAHSWSFSGTDGATVLAEQCSQYVFDEKGRLAWSKKAGVGATTAIYDIRDRLVMSQDANQAALATPQWTAVLYDNLDRSIVTTLYNTSSSVSTLRSDAASASASSTVTIANSGTYSVTAETSYNPISSTDLNNSSVCTVLGYSFYDDYSFSGVKTFNTNYTNLSAYAATDPDVEAITKTDRVLGAATGSMERVLGSTTFLFSTTYYDEKGRPLQGLSDNVKGGADITTSQYHFDGRVLSLCNDHTVPSTDYSSFKTLTKYSFDKLGRPISILKKWGDNDFREVVAYDYDDLGRLKNKTLDPTYTAGGNSQLEQLRYSFNLKGQLTGINKDYALKTTGSYNKWEHFFGMYLGYDNRDNVFINANLNGQITGTVWNTQGDDAQRRYDYTYDNAGRFINASYLEKAHTGDSWGASTMDFSVSGTSGFITYDLNGNLLNMLQKGVLPGTATPITIDNLTYTYAAFSNRLASVTDGMTATASNGSFGDFKDGTNGANPDYVYDANGNVVIDLNKDAKDLNGVSGANGISYNYLDKPEDIRLVGKGAIHITYSASGQKLQRTFTPEGGGDAVTTTYIGGFVYEQKGSGSIALQFMNFESGRLRVVTPAAENNGLDGLAIDGNLDLPGDKRGALDYYITDHLQNVRMILTEEQHAAFNTATMETDRSTLEESIFGQQGGGNEVANTRYATSSTGWTAANIDNYVSRTGGNAGHNVGPNSLLKVMAGDAISADVQYYYATSATGYSSGFLSNVVGSLVQAIGGSGATAGSHLVNANASAIGTQLNGASSFLNAVQPNGSTPAAGTPQAFLTVLFFDERFNLVPAADGGVQQVQVASSVGSTGSSLNLSAIKAPKNGYVFVYVSNQSDNDVFFDNFKVTFSAGNIIEENHYYAYGLKIAGISSKKLPNASEGSLKNNYLYQGAFSELDADMGWTDFELRNYDAQIGRWVQVDPYDQFASGYSSMGTDPIANIDPSGGLTGDGILGEVVVIGVRRISHSVAAVQSGLKIASRIFSFSNSMVRTAGALIGDIGTPSAGINGPGRLDSSNPVETSTEDNPKVLSEVVVRTSYKNKWTYTTWTLFYEKNAALGFSALYKYLQNSGVDENGLRLFSMAAEPGNVAFRKASDKIERGWRKFVEDALWEGATWYAGGVMFKVVSKVVKVGYEGYKLYRISREGMTDLQLVTRAAQKAEAAIGGTGGVAGTLKHTYAKNLLGRYQSIYGDRGLSVGSNYFNGPAGKGFLDVVSHETMTIYDFKFGNAVMSNSQFLKYSNSFPGYSIQVVRP